MFLKDPWESKIRWPIMKRKECCCCYLIHQFYRTIFKRKRPKMCRGTWSMEWLLFCSKTTRICTPKLYIRYYLRVFQQILHQVLSDNFQKKKRPKMCRGTWLMEWLLFCSKTTRICTPKLYIKYHFRIFQQLLHQTSINVCLIKIRSKYSSNTLLRLLRIFMRQTLIE